MKTIDRPATAKAAITLDTTPAPSPLQTKVAALRATVDKLRTEAGDQTRRTSDLEAIREKIIATRQDIADEKVDFVKGSAELQALTGQTEALEFTVEKCGERLASAYGEARNAALSVKTTGLRGIDLAEAAQLADRQAQIAKVMAGWAGEDAGDDTPVPVALIARSCPVLRKLEDHRVALEAWHPSAGVAALLEVAGPIAHDLANLPAAADEPPLFGGFSSRSRTVLLGWNGKDKKYDLLSEHESPAEAKEFFATIRERSGWMGFHTVSIFEDASPTANRVFHDGAHTNLDSRDESNALRTLPEITRWLGAA